MRWMLAVLALSATLQIGCESEETDFVTFTGTVRWKAFEGGFFAIDADNGERYQPINLPSSFREDGLRVRVTAVERPDLVSTHMYGKLIEIVTISRL